MVAILFLLLPIVLVGIMPSADVRASPCSCASFVRITDAGCRGIIYAGYVRAGGQEWDAALEDTHACGVGTSRVLVGTSSTPGWNWIMPFVYAGLYLLLGIYMKYLQATYGPTEEIDYGAAEEERAQLSAYES